jgi:hypothetical protein
MQNFACNGLDTFYLEIGLIQLCSFSEGFHDLALWHGRIAHGVFFVFCLVFVCVKVLNPVLSFVTEWPKREIIRF